MKKIMPKSPDLTKLDIDYTLLKLRIRLFIYGYRKAAKDLYNTLPKSKQNHPAIKAVFIEHQKMEHFFKNTVIKTIEKSMLTLDISATIKQQLEEQRVLMASMIDNIKNKWIPLIIKLTLSII